MSVFIFAKLKQFLNTEKKNIHNFEVKKNKQEGMSQIKSITRSQLQQVIAIFTKHFPESYADKSWDNTGLLINCSIPDIEATQPVIPKVLLTVDLTQSVAYEAIKQNVNLIIAYHPFIFPSWKNINPELNTQHDSAIKLIQNGISVYSPHTAMDAAKGGINDWLALGLVNNEFTIIESIESIEKIPHDPLNDTIGYGRLINLQQEITLSDLINNIKVSLNLNQLQIATNVNDTMFDITKVKKVALCAGSGSGVFKALGNKLNDIDVLYTGEMSHHDLLRLKEMGKTCIICNHSNTERGYLSTVLLDKLANEGIDCAVSATDMDPLRLV